LRTADAPVAARRLRKTVLGRQALATSDSWRSSFHDQNQGIRIDAPRITRLSRPFSFIRTLTVGFGIAPNLLTLLPNEFPRGISGEEGARGLGLVHPYRRWGISPRPENINRPV
jgi:hypothetical protein